MIPLIDLTTDEKRLEDIKKAVLRVIDSKSYILGPRLAKFERAFARFLQVKYAIGVASGTDALRLSLRALGIVSGDKVLTVAFTSPFTALAIIEEGATPVFCDVDAKTMTIDIADARRKIDKKTRAIVPVHIFGNPCDMTSLAKLARDFNLKIIEDACQAHGARFSGKRIGTFGDAAAFSFYPTKNLGAIGDAGMVVTNNRRVADMVRLLRHGGQTKRFWHGYPGINSRLDEIQAVILDLKLKNLRRLNHQREILVKRYREAFRGMPIVMQESFKNANSANHLFVLKTKKRDQLKKYLLANGVLSDIYYPYPVHKQNAFKKYAGGKLPVTEKLAREVLALPLYHSLTAKNQDKVILLVKKFFSSQK